MATSRWHHLALTLLTALLLLPSMAEAQQPQQRRLIRPGQQQQQSPQLSAQQLQQLQQLSPEQLQQLQQQLPPQQWQQIQQQLGLQMGQPSGQPGMDLSQPQMPEQPGDLPHPEVSSPLVVQEPTPTWMIVVSGLILLSLVALLFYFIFRKTAQVIATSTRRPLKDALRSMKELQSHADITAPSEIGQRVSGILRRYFLECYGLPAPFRTSQELFPAAELVNAPRRTRHVQERFGPLAAIYDTLAFGPSSGSREAAAALINTAISKLEEERIHENSLSA